MQKFEEWRKETFTEGQYEKLLGDLSDKTTTLRFVWEAGYNQRNKEIEEHYRKVMENEKSTEIGVPMSPVGDLDHSR